MSSIDSTNRIMEISDYHPLYSNSHLTLVLWDYENVPLPRRVSASTFFTYLRRLLLKMKFLGRLIVVVVAGLEENIPDKVRRVLEESDVKFEFAYSSTRNAADDYIHHIFTKFRNANRCLRYLNVILIGGDHFYVDTVKLMKRTVGFTVTLVTPCKRNTASDLLSNSLADFHCRLTYLLGLDGDILPPLNCKPMPSLGGGGAAATLIITNLPKDIPTPEFEYIIPRFLELLQQPKACDAYSTKEGSSCVVVEFYTVAEAERALRLDGRRLFGKPIVIKEQRLQQAPSGKKLLQTLQITNIPQVIDWATVLPRFFGVPLVSLYLRFNGNIFLGEAMIEISSDEQAQKVLKLDGHALFGNAIRIVRQQNRLHLTNLVTHINWPSVLQRFLGVKFVSFTQINIQPMFSGQVSIEVASQDEAEKACGNNGICLYGKPIGVKQIGFALRLKH